MSPDSTTRPSHAVTVIEVVGDLDIASQEQFQSAVTKTLNSSSVIVDLTGLQFLAISALGPMVVCQRAAGRLDRRLVYAAAPPDAQRLITMADLDAVLVLRPSVAAAWADMSAGGATAVDGATPSLSVQKLMLRSSRSDGTGRRPIPQAGADPSSSRRSGRTFTP